MLERAPRSAVPGCPTAPRVAASAAAAYLLAGTWLPVLLPVVGGALVAAAAALALARRPSRRLRLAVGAAGAVALAGCLGASLLADDPVSGFVFLVVGVFLAPLPLLPFLYARSFEGDGS